MRSQQAFTAMASAQHSIIARTLASLVFSVLLELSFCKPQSGGTVAPRSSLVDPTERPDSELDKENGGGEQEKKIPMWESGPMATISDSLFSLIILIYVSVIFIFMFFSFCWKEPEPPPPDPAHKHIPMITSILEEMEKQEEAKKEQMQKEEEEEGEKQAEMHEMQEKPLIEKENNGNAGEKITVNVITEKSSVVLPPIAGAIPARDEAETEATQV